GELLSRCRLLERVAAEVSRLAFLANKGKDLAFVRSLEPRIASHRAALRDRITAALAAALAPPSPAPPSPASAATDSPAGGDTAAGSSTPNPQPPQPPAPSATRLAAALHALHAAADLGESGAAEGAVRRVLVAPLVERVLAEHKAAGGHQGSFSSALAPVLSSLLSAIRSPPLAPLLDKCLAPGSPLRGLDLLAGALLEEVQGALAAGMPGVFSPGVPPAFHANYLALRAWLGQLEGLCATRGQVERLRGSAAYSALMRRWNTSVYFSLLYQEIAGELEDALSSDKLELLPPQPSSSSSSTTPLSSGGGATQQLMMIPTPQPPQLAATAALLRCLRRAVSPEVVLPPLADRFLRLVLQLARRYGT
ncbi:hypothetical protein Agub_g15628, partial [Astrephomene gubernaculifera]